MINKGQWTTDFPNIKFGTTTKQYFNQYCFKLVLFSPGGRSIYNKSVSIEKSLEIRQHISKSYNYGGSWRAGGASRYLNLADADLLNYIKNKKTELKNIIKIRVEEPFVTIYADSEDLLYRFAQGMPAKSVEKAELVAGPDSQSAMELLKTGAILLTKPNFYQFKITLRDGRYSMETKTNLYSYLKQLGEEVSLPDGPRSHLVRNSQWMYNVYFYCNDEKLVTVLNLIEPNIVRTINSLVFTNDE